MGKKRNRPGIVVMLLILLIPSVLLNIYQFFRHNTIVGLGVPVIGIITEK